MEMLGSRIRSSFVKALITGLLVLELFHQVGQCQSGAGSGIARSVGTHKDDFDYLLGDWAFTAESQQYGRFKGVWTAARDAAGRVVDNYRILGDGTQVYYSVLSIRAYDEKKDRWDIVSLEPGTGLQCMGSGLREGDEVHIDQTFVLRDDTRSILRITYHDITPDSFQWSADRSLDGGKTWQTNFQHLWVKRVGPPRAVPSILALR